MVYKCNYLKVLEVFFIEPTTIHFIKGISKRINLAPVSVKKYITELLQEKLVKRKESKPFSGFIANRESEDFIFYKRIYNLYTLKDLTEFIVSSYYPKLLVVYGSYARGEDVETSDIDLLILTKVRKELDLRRFENKLRRSIHLVIVDDLNKLDGKLLKKVQNGIVLYGGF